MDAQAEKKSTAEKSETPFTIVSFLGPISSYTHQVYTLSQYDRLAWPVELTDWDWAKAALKCFNPDRYVFQPATTITGEDISCLTIVVLLTMFGRRIRGGTIRRGRPRCGAIREF
jgi:hypothetical protein